MIVKGYDIKPYANLRGADLRGADLRGADLYGADLYGANLRGADLRGADLYGADLYGADLHSADLYGADLRGADLRDAGLYGADLYGADLRGAGLYGADLRGADLRGADLYGADLRGAGLYGALLPSYQIPQEGELIVWKQLAGGKLCKLRIPPEAKRTASLVGRKCRAEFAEVLEGPGLSQHDPSVPYAVGCQVWPDSYDPDPRVECTHGIHFFLTREEAEEY